MFELTQYLNCYDNNYYGLSEQNADNCIAKWLDSRHKTLHEPNHAKKKNAFSDSISSFFLIG